MQKKIRTPISHNKRVKNIGDDPEMILLWDGASASSSSSWFSVESSFVYREIHAKNVRLVRCGDDESCVIMVVVMILEQVVKNMLQY